MALSGTTAPGQSGPRSGDNERVLHISQRSIITGVSPSDCLLSYPGYSLCGGEVLLLCNRCILKSQSTGLCKLCGERYERVYHIISE